MPFEKELDIQKSKSAIKHDFCRNYRRIKIDSYNSLSPEKYGLCIML